jgi:ATP adenylyltransferase
VDHLWSPWRMEYILSSKTDGCVFCAKPTWAMTRGTCAAARPDCLRHPQPLSVQQRPPVGRALCSRASLEHLPVATLTEMMLLVNQGLAALRLAMQPEGFNIGVNLGKAAGAGIEPHVHIHVVPRWNGDTSFMSTIGETRTIPEALEQTYHRLQAALETMQGATTGREVS